MSAAVKAGFAGRVQGATAAHRLVFSFLSARDVCAAEQVCRAFKQASTPALWSYLYRTAGYEWKQNELDAWADQFARDPPQEHLDLGHDEELSREREGVVSDDEDAVESDEEDEGFVTSDAAGDACIDWKRKLKARVLGVNPRLR